MLELLKGVMTMMRTDLDLLNDYIVWKRDQELYPSRHSPEDYLQWREMSQAYAKVVVIKSLLDSDLTKEDFFGKIKELVETELEVTSL